MEKNLSYKDAITMWSQLTDEADRVAQEEIVSKLSTRDLRKLQDHVRDAEERYTAEMVEEYGENLTDEEKVEAKRTFSEIGAIELGNPRLSSCKYMTKFERSSLRDAQQSIKKGEPFFNADLKDAMRAGYAREVRKLDSFRGTENVAADCVVELEL